MCNSLARTSAKHYARDNAAVPLRYAALAEARFFKPGETKNDAAKAIWEQLDEEPVPGQDSVVIGAVNCIE